MCVCVRERERGVFVDVGVCVCVVGPPKGVELSLCRGRGVRGLAKQTEGPRRPASSPFSSIASRVPYLSSRRGVRGLAKWTEGPRFESNVWPAGELFDRRVKCLTRGSNA